MEDSTRKAPEESKTEKEKEPPKAKAASQAEKKEPRSSTSEQELDIFLLGDPGDSDDAQGNLTSTSHNSNPSLSLAKYS